MNIINAIYNLVNNPIVDILTCYSGKNRANNTGTALEEYVKDLFSGSFDLSDNDRLRKWNDVFSYLGNNNNPPDAMLRDGDAIEVKNNPMLSAACRLSEHWEKKDMIYAVGIVNDNKLQHFSMVYGLDYCASEECYARIKNTIKAGVESIPGVEFAQSKELGHINRVDPLGITYMRVRGMWGIENPWKTFDYVYQRDFSKSFTFMCIINENKWNSLDNTDLITGLKAGGFSICDVKIKNPDNPAQLVNAKLITYYID